MTIQLIPFLSLSLCFRFFIRSEITNGRNDDFFSSYGTHDESLLDNQSSDMLFNQSFSHNHSDTLHSMSQNMQESNPLSDPLSNCYTSHTTTAATSSSSLSSSSSFTSSSTTSCSTSSLSSSSYSRSSRSVDADLETLDRELNALDASMPLVDPEITQGSEQLEKAISRKRSRSEDDNDRLVREALSTFSHYLPSPRLLSGIDDCPLLMGSGSDTKRYKSDCMQTSSSTNLNDHLIDFEFDHNHNQNQKEFEVIMDALRLGGTSQSNVVTVGNGTCSDSCGQAAMMSENGSVFHSLVASLET